MDDINEYLFSTYYSEGELDFDAVGFGLLGFESKNYAKNIGSMWIFLFWKVTSGIFFMLVKRFAINFLCVEFYKKYHMNERIHAFLMIFVMQSYVELLISSLITIQLSS